MAIISTDLKKYLTGASSDGGAQSNPDASLGNYHSSTEITSGNDNNVFDDVSGAEASAGSTDYRVIAIKNTHATLDLTDAKVFVSTDDSNSDTTYSLCLERPQSSLTAGNAQTLSDEDTAPDLSNTTYHTGGAWTASTTCNSYANGLAVGPLDSTGDADLKSGEIIFVHIKRVIGSSAAAASGVSFTIRIQGDTAA